MSATVLTDPSYHVELVNGVETQKLFPKKLHAFIQNFLIVLLNRDLPAGRGYQVAPELNVLTGNIAESGRREYVVPDVLVTRRKALYNDGDLAEPPLFAVEILSPGQTFSDLIVRSERLLKLGTPTVWVIWPERRRAWIHSNMDLVEGQDVLRASLLDGDCTEILLAEMWAELSDEPLN